MHPSAINTPTGFLLLLSDRAGTKIIRETHKIRLPKLLQNGSLQSTPSQSGQKRSWHTAHCLEQGHYYPWCGPRRWFISTEFTIGMQRAWHGCGVGIRLKGAQLTSTVVDYYDHESPFIINGYIGL